MIPRPLGLRVLVKPLDPSEDSKIWIPNPVTPTMRGAVTSCGEDVQYLQEGDEVLFAHSGADAVEFTFEGERYYMIPESRVIALLDRIEQPA